MPSTLSAYPQVISRHLAWFSVVIFHVFPGRSHFVAGSIPGSSTGKRPPKQAFCLYLPGRHQHAVNVGVSGVNDTGATQREQ